MKALQKRIKCYSVIVLRLTRTKTLNFHESGLYKRLLAFFEKNEAVYRKQFGFRAKHSTDHAFLSILDKMQHAMENNEFSCGVFLDLSKAFDTVHDNVPMGKSKYYGIRGIA